MERNQEEEVTNVQSFSHSYIMSDYWLIKMLMFDIIKLGWTSSDKFSYT